MEKWKYGQICLMVNFIFTFVRLVVTKKKERQKELTNQKIEISVNDILKNINYSLDYFHKILRWCRVDNRFLLIESDLVKLLEYPITTQKSYELRIYINRLLDA